MQALWTFCILSWARRFRVSCCNWFWMCQTVRDLTLTPIVKDNVKDESLGRCMRVTLSTKSFSFFRAYLGISIRVEIQSTSSRLSVGCISHSFSTVARVFNKFWPQMFHRRMKISRKCDFIVQGLWFVTMHVCLRCCRWCLHFLILSWTSFWRRPVWSVSVVRQLGAQWMSMFEFEGH